MKKIFTCPVMGVRHYQVPIPEVGEIVMLMPEPTNEYDKYTIGVYNRFLQQVGYVRKLGSTSEYVTKLIGGKPGLGQISYKYESDHTTIILMDVLR